MRVGCSKDAQALMMCFKKYLKLSERALTLEYQLRSVDLSPAATHMASTSLAPAATVEAAACGELARSASACGQRSRTGDSMDRRSRRSLASRSLTFHATPPAQPPSVQRTRYAWGIAPSLWGGDRHGIAYRQVRQLLLRVVVRQRRVVFPPQAVVLHARGLRHN